MANTTAPAPTTTAFTFALRLLLEAIAHQLTTGRGTITPAVRDAYDNAHTALDTADCDTDVLPAARALSAALHATPGAAFTMKTSWARHLLVLAIADL